MAVRVHVTSTMFSWVEYDPISRRMRLCFLESGRVYDFCRVPPHLHQSFLSAPSKGVFFNTWIKGRYDC